MDKKSEERKKTQAHKNTTNKANKPRLHPNIPISSKISKRTILEFLSLKQLKSHPELYLIP